MKTDPCTYLGFSISIDLHLSRVICVDIPGFFKEITKDKDVGTEDLKCFLSPQPLCTQLN